MSGWVLCFLKQSSLGWPKVTDAQDWMEPWALTRPITVAAEKRRNQDGKNLPKVMGLLPPTSPDKSLALLCVHVLSISC